MDNINLNRQELENIYGKISPFEFKNKLIELANTSNRKSTRTLLDAGRGNPNWVAATPREAFFTFGHFAITESRFSWDNGDLTGIPKKTGIYNRFYKFINENSNMPGIETLREIIEYGINELNFNADDFLHELCDAIIGDNYPFPDRMLIHIEKIVKEYLKSEMKYNIEKGGNFNVFAVEGATAAMCYIFDSLIANNLLLKGDKIAIMTPVFTPYLEIPHLPRYEFEVVYINSDEIDENGERTWQCSDKELEKLIQWADVICIGCGLGTSVFASRLLKKTMEILRENGSEEEKLRSCPCIIDADGLNLLSMDMEQLQGVPNVILTPHMKEMSRLINKEIPQIAERRFSVVKEFTEQYQVVCALKDSRTVVMKEGHHPFLNLAGNSAMAKAGSGDVLAGMISGLAAQKTDIFDAVSAGVYFHACGGDEARKKKGSYSVLARDLIDGIGQCLKNAEERL